jgi:hypothetical protein
MSEEEPAWRAELKDLLDERFISSGEEIFDLVEPHIRAAEQRGRREAAEEIRRQCHEGHDQIKCVPCFVHGYDADLIDPDKP